MRFLRFSLSTILSVFLLLPVAYAAGDPMSDFYNGLADVVERNMNSPDNCTKEAESFIKNNIGPLIEVMKKSREMAKRQEEQYDQMSEEEMRQRMEEAGEALSQSGSMEALNRYMEVMRTFATNYPEHAEKIMETMSEYTP